VIGADANALDATLPWTLRTGWQLEFVTLSRAKGLCLA